jgi:hypothetical protein
MRPLLSLLVMRFQGHPIQPVVRVDGQLFYLDIARRGQSAMHDQLKKSHHG